MEDKNQTSETQPSSALDLSVIKKAGLTDSQAKGYLALLTSRGLTPAEIAKETGESRTNAYQIAEKLTSLGLAIKSDSAKKTLYQPTHPSALELLAEKRRRVIEKNEQSIKSNIPALIDLFNAHNELPGARTIQGLDGIKEVYRQTLVAKTDIHLLRTRADADLDLPFLLKYRENRVKAGINTFALTPPSPEAFKNAVNDKEFLFHRTFLPESDYSAPVEINVFCDKLALTSYGKTQMTIIIDSPPIAESLRQILKLLIATYSARPTPPPMPPS